MRPCKGDPQLPRLPLNFTAISILLILSVKWYADKMSIEISAQNLPHRVSTLTVVMSLIV